MHKMPPPREKIYCGLKPILPDGYARFGLAFECLKKGYGACLYTGKLGSKRTLFSGINRWLIVILVLLLLFAVLGWVGIVVLTIRNKKTPK